MADHIPMNFSDIARQRLYNGFVTHPTLENPAEVVAWFGAVQAQEYGPAKWALAQRTKGMPTDTVIEQAFTEGAILRTHVMRPTWHFVTPADIRWMLALTAPRVHATCASYYRKQELDDATIRRSNDTLVKALEGGKQLTRKELAVILQQAGINTDDLRLGFLIMRAELDGVVCSGPRRGKQFTYMLLEERVPPARNLEREEALAELTQRYFRSHGPALLKDFVWWSGLTVADAREGIELIKSQLVHDVINEQSYWTINSTPRAQQESPSAYLLPIYDESLASYKEYSAAVAPQYADQWRIGELVFTHYLVVDNRIIGSWKRTFAKKSVMIELKPFVPLAAAQSRAVTAAAERFGEFLELPVVLSWAEPFA